MSAIKGRKNPKIGETTRARHGDDFYARLGARGGAAKVPKGFALMDKAKVSACGKKGGSISRRRAA
jgi:general stress protein YciG